MTRAIRSPSPRLRRPMLYPVELQAQKPSNYPPITMKSILAASRQRLKAAGATEADLRRCFGRVR